MTSRIVTATPNPRASGLLLCLLAAVALTAMVGAPVDADSAVAGPSTRVAADGSIGLRLLDAPVSAGTDPRAQLYIVDHLAPGTVIHRRIEVSNTTTAALPVVLYSAAATIANGSFLGADGRTPNDLSAWTSVTPDEVDVPTGGLMTATVTIAVPRDAAPGEQYGVVWAEAAIRPVAGAGVTQTSRVGIRLYLSVGPGNPPAADFAIESLTAERSPGGQPMVVAAVHNTGGRALDLSGTLQLSSGPAGLSAGPFPVTLGTTVAIDDWEPATIVLDNALPAGPWAAQITLRSGLLEITERATITFPETGAAAAVSTESNPRRWLYPAIGGLILLLCFGALLVVLKHRRRTPRHRHAR